MEEMSSIILPRKRKQFSSLTSLKPCMGPITRSQYRSGRVCSDAPSPRNLQQLQLIPDSSLKKPKSIQCPILQNSASLELSIRDLRARARRVFSPAGSIVGQNELGFDIEGEISNGSLKIMENSGDFEYGLKNLDLGPGSGPGFCVSDKEEKEKSSNRESSSPGSKDLDLGMGNQGPSDEKMNMINQVESGNDCCENKKNGSISSTNMVRKPCSRGKVYKSPSLFSYRRLLPFLVDMVKEESCTTRIEIVDNGRKVEDSINADSYSSSVLTDSKFPQPEHIGENSNGTRPENSNGTRPPDEKTIQKVEIQHEVKVQDLHDPDQRLSQNEGDARLSNVEGRSHENGISGGDELIEEHIQTTPPDFTILSELDLNVTDGNAEVIDLKTRNPVLGYPSSGSNCSNHVPVLKRSYPNPTQRNNNVSTTKLVLNPCSRSKIYKTSSSLSYRRLLPFLMDVAKSSSNNDRPPKFQKHVESSQHSDLSVSLDNDIILNKNEACDFQDKKQDKCLVLNFPTSINHPSIDGSSDGICQEISTPFITSSSEISFGKTNSACSENYSGLDMVNDLQMERTFPHKHGQLNEPRKFEGGFHDADIGVDDADIGVGDAEFNQSVKTSCTSGNHKFFPGESRLEVSHHQPLDIVKHWTPNSIVYHEDKVDRIKSVTLEQSSSKNGVFYFQGTESPTKGILKRNPRGCRGLCNCLNCSSFRLHAERAFEFSRNQMLDAEEVVLMLIDELGELRDMLEKSVVDGRDLSAIQFEQLLVRESCKKVLAMEQQAKQRLSQMNEDLNVHCRTTPLQRPRVTFSRYIEVKSIPETKLSESS